MVGYGCFLIALLVVASPSLSQSSSDSLAQVGDGRPTIRALHVEGAILVDGDLSDEAWSRAEIGGDFTQREPRAGEPASEPTEFSVAYSPSTLYFAVRAFDSDPSALLAKEMERDGSLYQDDSILIVLDTFHDLRNGYVFETNPNGARRDSLVSDEGRDVNTEWDGVWASAARRTADGWVAELAIPFSTLRFDPSLDTWGLNVQRLIRRKNEETHWAALPLEAGTGTSSYSRIAVHRISLAGTLTGLESIRPSRRLDVKPYVLASGSEDMQRDDTMGDIDAGLDVKWGVARSLALDLTVNTDFAEVEVDEQQVNLTRFSLFFPEKRDFFLENAGIFGFGPPRRVPWEPTLMEVFFSRRIGLEEGQVVPIEWGGRLTGRTRGWNLGVLGVRTEAVDEDGLSVPGTDFVVGRVKRNLGERSSLGAIFTQRQADGGEAERVYGVDLEYKPQQRWDLSGFWARSDRPDVTTDDASFGAGVEYQGPELTASVDFVEAEEGFEPGVGFLLREDFRLYHPQFRWRPRIERHGIRYWYADGSLRRYERSSDGQLESQALEVSPLGMMSERGDFWLLGATSSKERIFVPFEIFPGVVIPPGLYEFDGSWAAVTTNTMRRIALDIQGQWGDFYDGEWVRSQSVISLRLSRYFRAHTSWIYNDVDLPQGAFEVNVYGQRIDISFTPVLRLNILAQYNDASRSIGLNARFHWIYRPGADLFVVYNEDWDAPTFGARQATGRQLIVKFNYLFQR